MSVGFRKNVITIFGRFLKMFGKIPDRSIAVFCVSVTFNVHEIYHNNCVPVVM